MSDDLSTEYLRTFLAIVDAGTMLAAANRVNRTPSAVSLQMKRLEDQAGVSLFARAGRRVELTAAGRALVPHARQILDTNDTAVMALRLGETGGLVRIGIVQDFAGDMLSGVLGSFSRRHKAVRLEVRVGTSGDLRDAVGDGRLDFALHAAASADRRDCIRRDRMLWIGPSDLAARTVVPLALVPLPCPFRRAALSALKKAGRKFEIVVETPSLDGIRAAVSANLALTVRTAHFARSELPVVRDKALPPLGGVGYVISARPTLTPLQNALRALLADALGVSAGSAR